MPTDLIARERELGALEAFLDQPADGVSAFVIEGEPGIGKSTLWKAAIAAAIDRSHRVLVARPVEAERTLANVALGDLFGRTTADDLEPLPDPQRRAFEAAVMLREEHGEAVDPRTLGVAILSLLRVLAAGRPLLIAIDDEQWLDSSSASILAFALRRAESLPIKLLLSRRALDPGTVPLEQAIEPRRVTREQLGPISLGATLALLSNELGTGLPRPMLVRIHEVSGGNPFYALELGRAQALDDGGPAGRLNVPPSLERLLGARLRPLPQPTREALLLIAAHGRLAQSMLRDLAVAPMTLEVAQAAKLIETEAGVVRFAHPLFASIAYQLASPDERIIAHRRLSTAIDDPAQRARHLALATDAPDADVAATLETAAEAASARGMAGTAAELAEHAARLTPEGASGDRHRRALAAARATLSSGDQRRTRTLAGALLTLARGGDQRAQVLILLAELEPPGLAVPLLGSALEEAAGVPELEAAIHARLAQSGRFTHGVAWAEEHARALLRHAEQLDDDQLRASALATLALLEFDSADPAAIPRAYEAHRLAESIGEPRPLAEATWAVANVLAWSGRTSEARAWLEAQMARWQDRDEQLRAELIWCLAFVDLATGAWPAAEQRARQSIEISDAYGRNSPGDRYIPAMLAMYRGDLPAARQHAQHALARADAEFQEDFLAVLGTCDLWSGDPAGAVEYLQKAEQTADARGLDDPSMRTWRADLVEALLQVGKIGDARRLIDPWGASARRLGRTRTLAAVTRCRGLIAAAQGDLDDARSLLEQAVEAHAAADDPFGRARALLALGRVAIRARQKRRAREAFSAAVEIFEAIGAIAWAAEAQAELGRLGGRRRFEGLSPSETRVAVLAGAGRTNREIAAELFLGERTVASHLTHAYAKLGVRSRTELARAMGSESPDGDGGKVPTS